MLQYIAKFLDEWIKNISTLATRSSAGAIELSEDEFLIVGGFEFPYDLTTTEICSLSSGCTESIDIESKFYHPQIVRMDEENIFVLQNEFSKTWRFNQKQTSWSRLPDLLQRRENPFVGFVNGHEVVVAGGRYKSSSEIFDTQTQEWRMGPDLPDDRELCCGSSVQYKDTFLIIGGEDGGEQDAILEFDPVNYEWKVLPHKLKTARNSFAAVLVPNDYISCS